MNISATAGMENLLGYWVVPVCISVLVLWLIRKFKSSRQRIDNLHEKAVLITGCTGEFGSQLAKRLDALGVTVYAGARSPDGDAAVKLKEACSSKLQFLKLDVTREDDIAEAVKTVRASLGDKKLWAVVNNAGAAHYTGFEWTSMEIVNKMLYTNLLGPMWVTTAFLPLLKESCGRVVIVSSLTTEQCVPGMAPYCASKSGLAGFGDAIRRELKSWSVSVHFVCPYLYRTKIANPETLLNELETSWKTSNVSKSSYPSTYLENFKKCFLVFLSLGESAESAHEVAEDLEHATVGAHPKIKYYPGPVAKLFKVCSNLPDRFIDYCFSLFAPPTQEGETNRFLDFLYSRINQQH